MAEVCPKFAHRTFPQNICSEEHSAVVHKAKALVFTAMNTPNYLRYQHEFNFLTYKGKKTLKIINNTDRSLLDLLPNE